MMPAGMNRAPAPIDQIATTLEVSVNSVKTHLQRALASLERVLERES